MVDQNYRTIRHQEQQIIEQSIDEAHQLIRADNLPDLGGRNWKKRLGQALFAPASQSPVMFPADRARHERKSHYTNRVPNRVLQLEREDTGRLIQYLMEEDLQAAYDITTGNTADRDQRIQEANSNKVRYYVQMALSNTTTPPGLIHRLQECSQNDVEWYEFLLNNLDGLNYGELIAYGFGDQELDYARELREYSPVHQAYTLTQFNPVYDERIDRWEELLERACNRVTPNTFNDGV